jgi:hypothetical protein
MSNIYTRVNRSKERVDGKGRFSIWAFSMLPQATEIHIGSHLVHPHATHCDIVGIRSL